MAGEFFHERAQRLANALIHKDSLPSSSELEELPLTLTIHEAASEHVTLLSLARPWFDGTHNETVGHWSNLTQDHFQWKEDSYLQDIDAKMLRSSVVAQAEAHNPNKQSACPSAHISFPGNFFCRSNQGNGGFFWPWVAFSLFFASVLSDLSV